MNDRIQHVFRQLLIAIVPYIVIGIAITFIIGLFILSYYLFLWGLIIGFTLWLCALIKRYFFTQKQPKYPVKKTKGRIIDHDNSQE